MAGKTPKGGQAGKGGGAKPTSAFDVDGLAKALGGAALTGGSAHEPGQGPLMMISGTVREQRGGLNREPSRFLDCVFVPLRTPKVRLPFSFRLPGNGRALSAKSALAIYADKAGVEDYSALQWSVVEALWSVNEYGPQLDRVEEASEEDKAEAADLAEELQGEEAPF